MQAHVYQRTVCATARHPILNAACKEDPACLGVKYNATNLDITDYCHFSNTDLKTLRNYIQGDVLNLRATFDAQFFPTIVLGEFLEHCVPSAAKRPRRNESPRSRERPPLGGETAENWCVSKRSREPPPRRETQ